MDQDPRTTGSPPGATQNQPAEETRSPDEIRADIEQTREEVGDTVEALTAKTDVKSQAQQRIADAKATVRRKRDELTSKAKKTTPPSAQQGGRQLVAKVRENPAPVAIGGAAFAGFLLGRLTRRRP